MKKPELLNGDCLDVLAWLEPNSIDALITDPPAGINFMNKEWDHNKGGREQWVTWMTSVMRLAHAAMKPGAHGLIWAIPRTSHWTATALEDAGFEVRDVVTHLFGSGFPKSLDVSKAIDKAAGLERQVVGDNPNHRGASQMKNPYTKSLGQKGVLTSPASAAWDGWGTALKPASEHWILVRKPISEKTVAANVLKWGTGAINIDGSRIDSKPRRTGTLTSGDVPTGSGASVRGSSRSRQMEYDLKNQGRFPANLVLSHSPYCEDDQCDLECPVKMLDAQSGTLKNGGGNAKCKTGGGFDRQSPIANPTKFAGDSGGASRFFYCAKISKSERNAGLEGMPEKESTKFDGGSFVRGTHAKDAKDAKDQNFHPTVKSKKLMSYLINLITPPNGTVLDPFMGSGSTGIAAKECGFNFIGIEKEAEYFEIAKKRITHAK